MICERDYGCSLPPDVRVFHVKKRDLVLIKIGMQLRGYKVTIEKI